MAPGAVRHGGELVHSYLALRKAIGGIAIALPFVLLALHGAGLRSVSHGYYTHGGAVFVAAVCTIGTFLLFYRGFDRRDRAASFVAGAAALVVGLVPCGDTTATAPVSWWGWGEAYALSTWPRVHLLAAAVLFIVLALFCLWLFPMTDAPQGANPRKAWRNRVYRVCGLVIVGCLAALLMHFLGALQLGPDGVFWLETVMLVAFGLSWAVKGQAIAFLNDPGAPALAPRTDRQPD